MCVCIEIELEESDDARLGDSLGHLPLSLAIRRTGMPGSRRTFGIISGGDADSSDLLADRREELASLVEALDKLLTGERVLRADWIGVEPSGEASLSAPDLAARIRTGAFKQGVTYRVGFRGFHTSPCESGERSAPQGPGEGSGAAL